MSELKKGSHHYSGQCPEEDRRTQRGSNSTQYGTSMIQADNDSNALSDMIDREWLLLDTCSTNCVGCNADLIDNICDCTEEEILHIATNGGSLVYSEIGINKLIPIPMHYNPDSIANVLSLSVVADIPGFRITMDTDVDRSITVHINNDVSFEFQECKHGLFYYNTNANNKNNTAVNEYTDFVSYNFFINSISNNKKSYNEK